MTANKLKVKQLEATTTVGDPGVDTLVPTEKAVRDALDAVPGGSGVTRSGATTNNHLAVWDGDDADSIKDGGAPAGGGDVYGDAGATDGNLAVFDGDGYHIKDGGPVPAGGSASPSFQGNMLNGKIVVSVTSNNLTVALKNLAGNDPSAGDPVLVRIGDTIRTLTAALSVTKNAGTNWCNAGGAELATKEVDYFVYLGYNSTDGVVIGFSRIPFGLLYSDFSTTTTNEKYCGISTIANAAAGDCYENIGRFAATLSAGAGYTWTVPTFTNANLIQRPIFESRWLDWVPTYSGNNAMTYTSVVTTKAKYRLMSDHCYFMIYAAGTTGGSASTLMQATTPFATVVNAYVVGNQYYQGGMSNWSAGLMGVSNGKIQVGNSTTSILALAADSRLVGQSFFTI